MAISTLSYVEQAMRDYDYPYWIVKSDSQVLGRNDNNADKKIDLEVAIQRLKDCVNAQTGGLLTITISNLTGKEKNAGGSIANSTFTYLVRAKETVNNPMESSDNATIAGLYETIAKQKYENEIATLKARIVELEEELNSEEETEEDNSIIAGIFKEVQPYIKPMIGKFLGSAMPSKQPAPIADDVSQPTPGEQQKATPEQIAQAKKCASGAQRILKVDEYFGDRVLQLAWLVEHDKASYDMACNLLNSMANKNT